MKHYWDVIKIFCVDVIFDNLKWQLKNVYCGYYAVHKFYEWSGCFIGHTVNFYLTSAFKLSGIFLTVL